MDYGSSCVSRSGYGAYDQVFLWLISSLLAYFYHTFFMKKCANMVLGNFPKLPFLFHSSTNWLPLFPFGSFLYAERKMIMKMAEYLQLKEEERREMAMKAEKKAHKCNGCMWGKWAGNKFSCAFANCIKDKL